MHRTLSVMSGLLCILMLLTLTASAQTVKLHVSSKSGDRISAKPDVQFSEATSALGATFEIDDSVKLQKMEGFGASIMEAGLMTLNTLLG